MLKAAAPILAIAALAAFATPATADPWIEISDPYTCHALYLNVTVATVNRPGVEFCPPKP